MGTEIHTCIVIPCYNEEKRFPSEDYISFIEETPSVLLCFVNDGSTDNTLETLNVLKNKYPEKIDIVSYSKNAGKGEAVRQGFFYCNSRYNFQHIAYLDSDLSISLQECYGMKKYFSDNVSFCFGSKVKRIGAEIELTAFRYLAGRVIASLISRMLGIQVHDTQCGCKLFTKDLSEKLFEDKFISKWLFDVEIFFRMLILFGKTKALDRMKEIPLIRCAYKGGSKVKITYFFRLWLDLTRINNKYKKLIKAQKPLYL
ncbi:MAG TPA: glycosyltransferase [Bacteroidales bacterium]|nr:glycosyltransferase [Bacteroidales bacterium]